MGISELVGGDNKRLNLTKGSLINKVISLKDRYYLLEIGNGMD